MPPRQVHGPTADIVFEPLALLLYFLLQNDLLFQQSLLLDGAVILALEVEQ